MKARCNNPKDAQYKTYGAKGVTVCKEWRTVSKFLEWALPKWEKGLVLDKDILSDKLNIFPHIYSPDTCQFITRKENNEYSNGRRSFGANKNIKISLKEAEEILDLRANTKLSIVDLSKLYKVSRGSIYYIMTQHKASLEI
ncbi:MAG: XRE family transcriptional regulator [Verrucomicrobia bacterium]|nr:MAG: XRE family transcriptional regulator [Verrucomicrobiota bacterium]